MISFNLNCLKVRSVWCALHNRKQCQTLKSADISISVAGRGFFALACNVVSDHGKSAANTLKGSEKWMINSRLTSTRHWLYRVRNVSLPRKKMPNVLKSPETSIYVYSHHILTLNYYISPTTRGWGVLQPWEIMLNALKNSETSIYIESCRILTLKCPTTEPNSIV